MRQTRIATYICLTALMSACSSDPGPDPSDTSPGPDATAERDALTSDLDADAAHEATTDADAAHEATPDVQADGAPVVLADRPTADGDVASCIPGRVWKNTSRVIELTASHFYYGRSGYRKGRNDLTTEQLAALDKLCVITPQPGQVFDSDAFSVAITDADGSVARYRAVGEDYAGGDLSSEGLPTIGSAELRAFRGTFSCLSARDTLSAATPVAGDAGVDASDAALNASDAGVDATDADVDASDAGVDASGGEASSPDALPANSDASNAAPLAPLVGDDPGCLNGVFALSTCTNIRLRVKISTPGVYELATEQCLAKQTSIHLFSPDGSAELAASDATTAPVCAAMTYTFGQAGVYPLELQRRSAEGCSGTVGIGSFLFRVTPVR
jgi:hypothetical protein